MKNPNKNNCIIWCTDNNGEICNNENNSQIGNWTYSNKCERGNGEKLDKMTNKYNVNVMNTFFNPKNDEKNNLATWIIGDGAIENKLTI